MKRDERGRRSRNTLTVDLGIYGLPLLDACIDGLGQMIRSRGQVRRGRSPKRSEVIRFALKVLHMEIRGVANPLQKALDERL